MLMKSRKILWVDDEIELFRSHIILLTDKGYDIVTSTNGVDALEILKEQEIDLVFLDEMMPGLGGLELLSKIKDIYSSLPVVMITKSEEEAIMNEAIGGKIADYLTKPVNASQILLVCKKIFDTKKLAGEHVAKDYLQNLNQFSQLLL